MTKARFEIKKSADGKYVFNLKSANDQVILTSQTYESKEGAEIGIASIRQNAAIDGQYEEKTGTDGHPYFLLIAANKQVIGRSQMYSSRDAMRKGIASVKRNARNAEVVDFTTHLRASGGGESQGAA